MNHRDFVKYKKFMFFKVFMKKIDMVVTSHFLERVRERFITGSDGSPVDALKEDCQEGEEYKHFDGNTKIYLPNVGASIPIAKDRESYVALSIYSTPHLFGIKTEEVKIKWY